MAVGLFLFFVTLLVYSVHTEVPFITKCLSSDTTCVRQSAQAAIPYLAAGIPELNVQSLDPLHIDRVESHNNDLRYTSTDAVITGLKNCVVENILRDPAISKIEVGMECDILYKSKYDVHGQILLVPFEGTGDMTVKLRKIYINVDSVVTVKPDKSGQRRWSIKSFKYNYELRGKSEIELTHLFDGNEILGRAARDLLKSSGNELVIEVGPPIIKAIVDKIIKTINQFYHSTTTEDLALD